MEDNAGLKVVCSFGLGKKPVVIDDAQAILICGCDGTPLTIYHNVSAGGGFLRLTKGEDKNFDEIAKQLNLR